VLPGFFAFGGAFMKKIRMSTQTDKTLAEGFEEHITLFWQFHPFLLQTTSSLK